MYISLAELAEIAGIAEDETACLYLRKWLHQSVAMALNDDTDPYGADGVLVIQNPQGAGKTLLFSKLALYADWFAEGISIDLDKKDSVIQATGCWIAELGELDSTLKREQLSLKAFITSHTDTYRQPYARAATRKPRRTSFCATVNPTEFLNDETGSRRWWVIRPSRIDIDHLKGLSREWVCQLWAQVYSQLYLPNPQGFRLTEDERKKLTADNEQFSKPLPGETEIPDKLEWESPVKQWKMVFTDGKQVLLPYADVIHLRRHYSTNEMLGSDNAPLYPLIDTAHTLTEATGAAVKNATNIRGVLKFTSLVNPAQVKAEKEQFVRDYFNPANTGGIAATDQRFEFIPTTQAAYTVPHEQTDAVNRQIYSYLGLSPKIVSGDYTEDEFAAFYESLIEPLAIQMSLEFTRKCGTQVTFTAERLEFSRAATRISLLRELLPFGVISINEARRLLALPEVADGDKRLQSLNYVTADKAEQYQLQESEET